LLACSPEINNSTLAGKWETKNMVMEIFQDGKIVFCSDKSPERSEGSYEFIKDDTIRLKLKGSNPEVLKLSLFDDRLTATHADGEIFAIYKRVK
jgi:hypothetical protein